MGGRFRVIAGAESEKENAFHAGWKTIEKQRGGISRCFADLSIFGVFLGGLQNAFHEVY